MNGVTAPLGWSHLGLASERADWTVEQDWTAYSGAEHQVWRTLFNRQSKLLRGRACPEYIDGLAALGVAASGIPDFRRLNDVLGARTGWRVVAVPGLVPGDVFFEHLANRRFPAGCFIRRPDQLDYIEEPDIFHDVFGHVPLLANPVFADYMQAYGRGGVKAARHDSLDNLSRLYWHTVEFGLIRSPSGLRIYGSGIVSSAKETVYALDDPRRPRIAFDLMRIMRTKYKIDDLQAAYFVIDSFEQLFEATRPDFTPYYEALKSLPEYEPGDLAPGDRLIDASAPGRSGPRNRAAPRPTAPSR